jgi:deoxycytidylate deaminase
MILDISKKDMRFINIAYDASLNSPMLMKHGCVVTCNNKYITSGYNSKRNKFNGNIIPECFSCHAEMDALRKAIKIKLGHNTKSSMSSTQYSKCSSKKRKCFLRE